MTNILCHPALSKYQHLPIGYAEITVPFHDVDLMEVVWHGHYAKYFELARCAVLKLIDYDYDQMRDSGYLWPIVDAKTRFISPAVYDDKLGVASVIVGWELRLVVKYFIFNLETKERVTKGQTVQVPLNASTKDLCFGCPEILQHKIEAWKRTMDTASG